MQSRPFSPQLKSPLQRQMTITLSLVIVSLLLLVAVPIVLISVQLQRREADLAQQATADRLAQSLSDLVTAVQSGQSTLPPTIQSDPRIAIAATQITAELDKLVSETRRRIEQNPTDATALPDTPNVLGVMTFSADGTLTLNRWRGVPQLSPKLLTDDETFDVARRGTLAVTLMFGTDTAIPLLIFATPTAAGNVQVMVVDATEAWQALASLTVGANGYLYITNRQGQPIIAPTAENPPDAATVQTAIAQKTAYRGRLGSTVVGHSAAIKGTPWQVVIELPQAEANAGLRSLLIILGAILLFALALAITTARIFSGWILQPIKVLHASAERISRGELSHRISLERDDELGFLASAFNQMVATLEKTIDDLRTVSRRLLSAEEAERRRIAHEIHDELGQTLTALRFSLSMVAKNSPQSASLQAVQEMAAEAQEKARTLSHELRPAMLDDIGLIATLEWYIDRVEQRANLAIGLDAALDEQVIPIELKTTLYRLVVEALTNISKHAQASAAEISLHHSDGQLRLTITDDGCGFDAAALAGTPSLGIAGMRERVNLLRGKFSIESQPGSGTKIEVVLPV